MRTVFLAAATLAIVAGAEPDWREGLSPRIETLKKQIGAPNAMGQFWEEMKARGTPMVESIAGDSSHVLVTFVYRSAESTKSVVLSSQLAASRDPLAGSMARLPNTDVWYKTYWMRNDFRLSYSFVLNPAAGSSAGDPLADPLNPKKFSGAGYTGLSVLDLPAAPLQPWSMKRAGVPSGKLEEEEIDSKVLKARRGGWIYTPAGYDPKRPEPYPLLICFDGAIYRTADYMPVPTILDNLIADGKIPPMVAVLVAQSAQPGRNNELSNNQPFLDCVADELLPDIRRKWRVTSDPSQTVVNGSSAGGLASVFFALRRPEVFGNVLSQSGALWPGQTRDNPQHEWVTRQYESSPKLPIRFVLQAGLLEVVNTPFNGPSILTCNRHLRDVLTAKGYELYYNEAAGGHEPLNWRGGLAEGLIQLMGKAKTSSQDHGPVDAVQGIVAAFQKHPVVIIAEARHGLRQMGDFYVRLVRDPAFQNTVQDIVIEFASRNNQPLLDRYVRGDDIPMEEVRHIWRDTTKVGAWEFPICAEWLAAIREVNIKLPPARRFRVLAGDTAIDWNRMHTRADWDALGENNISFADVIMNEVLKKKRRAFVVLGGNHVMKLGDRTGAPNTTTRVEAKYPGSTYVVLHFMNRNDPVEAMLRLADPAAPALYDLAGGPLGAKPDHNGVAPLRYTDAYLYAGPPESMKETAAPPGSLEPTYMKEVDRRSMIEWGELRARKFLGAAAAQ